jgi:ElaB/YqjD/DUF883 family membrane-anchored ribosome-binding protein
MPTQPLLSGTDIEARKEQLRKELEQIEQDLGLHLEQIKTGIQEKVDPRGWIREHPLASVGLAIGVGILLGARGRKRNLSATNGTGAPAWSAWTELKKVLTSRAISMAVDASEQLLAQQLMEKRASSTGNE